MNTTMSHIINYLHYPCYTIFIAFKLSGENDSNTLRVDPYIFKNGGKNLRFQNILIYVSTGPKISFEFTPNQIDHKW